VAAKSEFTVQNAYPYNHSSTFRWILSHIWRYRLFLFISLATFLSSHLTYGYARVLIGQAAEEILKPTVSGALLQIGLGVLFVLVLDGITGLIGSLSNETVAQRLERDAREELYISLLSKSQTFHDRQRVGDIMARATDDMRQVNVMMNPGIIFIYETVLGTAIPILYIGSIRLELMLVPLLFIVTYIVAVRNYSRRLNPVVNTQREQFGVMNAGLEETISGIEVVKATAQEPFERGKFRRNAAKFREYFVKQGRVESTYLPLLLYGIAVGLMFLHCIVLYQGGGLRIADIVAVMGLMAILRFPVFISIFSFSLVQLGIASARRILAVINAEADLDENAGGHSQPIKGEIIFENVGFGYDDGVVLENISFRVQPGETVAIVGMTGSGKSTLTELINRTYDVTDGRILIDGVDVRDWNLTALRSQISKIEQDVFLFSRSLGENIAFGAPGATQAQIEGAAREAQVHDFILSFKDGYQTKVGERGVTLSGGQRQRIALARAFLSDPRILILDDSTSAIDSATEDEIQRAIDRAQQGRTTLLITHRLSQIRWADYILVMDKGRLVARGTHEELLRRSELYRRIFARYDVELPPLEAAPEMA
jgi:ATP-binding cassette subfamily B protein